MIEGKEEGVSPMYVDDLLARIEALETALQNIARHCDPYREQGSYRGVVYAVEVARAALAEPRTNVPPERTQTERP